MIELGGHPVVIATIGAIGCILVAGVPGLVAAVAASRAVKEQRAADGRAEKHAAELLQAHASAAERLDKIHALVNGSMTSAMATTTVGHQILDFCRRLIHVARRRRFRVECFPRAENLDP